MFETTTEPKFASGSGLQSKPEHDDGASAIHSAEETSGAFVKTFFVNLVCLVRLISCRVTTLPGSRSPRW